MSTEELKWILKTLTDYNNWRRDDNVPNKYEMPNPRDVGMAVDMAIKLIKQTIKQNQQELF